MASVDVIVIGVGGMGSAACYHLARRGARVLGIERFGPVHDRGSSHGQTRIIRQAYFEHPDYVPLLQQAYALWGTLEEACGAALFARCGLLMAGRPESALIAGTRLAARAHGLPLEQLDGAALQERWPGFAAPAGFDVLLEQDAGFLRVEACVGACIEQARAHGAMFRWNCPVRGWRAGDGVTVTTDAGEVHAGSLVVCGGPWAAGLLADVAVSLQVLRKSMLWIEAADEVYRLDRGCPVFAFDIDTGDVESGPAFVYGFPVEGGTAMKIANHRGGTAVADPADVDRSLRAEDTALVHPFVARHLPRASARVVDHAVCMYTMTPDEHFVIDRSPRHDNVVFAAGFSGHGYKFAAAVGAILADLALDGRTAAPIGFLGLDRPALFA